tara:strand:+ start:5093 stop:5998 length:906 start_codon:yes stop_codon:yes gene_type:complete
MEDKEILGKIKHTDFVETLIPAFKPDAHDIYVKHIFLAKKEVENWKINKVEFTINSATLYLSASENTLSVASFSKTQNKNTSSYLKPFHIVEVDFGFYSDVFNINGEITKNHKKITGLLPGEMHKRRPCIVLNEKNGCVQVIPLSAKKRSGQDPQHIVMHPSSFLGLSPRYTEKRSYALMDMIQTVSASRIFPPRSKYYKYEHKYHNYKISSSDRDAMKLILSTQYNKGLEQKFNILNSKYEKLNAEKMKILQANNRIKDELSENKTNQVRLEQFILNIGSDFDFGKTIEEVLEQYALQSD